MILFLLVLLVIALGAVVYLFLQLQQMRQKLQSVSERVQGILDMDAELARVRQETTNVRAEADAGLVRVREQTRKETAELTPLRAQAATVRAELRALEEQADLRDFGFYKPHFDFSDASRYQAELDVVREEQKRLLQNKTAAVCGIEWTVNGSKTEGRKSIEQTLRLQLRAFNGECDAAIARVRYNNVTVMEARMAKAYETINKLAQVSNCRITPEYWLLKVKELHLVHEWQEKVQEEKEEQRRIREQMREEEVAQRELEEAKEDAAKEEARYQSALEKARREVATAAGEKQQKLLGQIAELERLLADATAKKERAISRAQMTRSGHVYIISNIGSFGEEVFKIGMTRRLDPLDRVRELGDASVPFPFDVHAIVYSDDAPGLENALHKAFHHQRLNRINERKEFFRASLDGIAAVVTKQGGKIELTRLAEAKEYRQTMALLSGTQVAGTPKLPSPFVLSTAQANQPLSQATPQPYDAKLAMLNKLREDGVVSAAEYEARRQRLLQEAA